MPLQQFHTRNYSVRDFSEWEERGELILAAKFQRRAVWKDKAKSFLIDTIISGKPIPKLYMRQDVNPSTRKTRREIVDGQQRLRTVLSFIEDGFKVSRTHNKEHGNKYYSGLDPDVQGHILKYEFVVDLLQDMPDTEVYDIFARINTYGEKLRPQELRNAKFFGEFKSAVYELARESGGFFADNKVFTNDQILRMAEAEFISEILLAMHEGIREGKKPIIDKAYKQYDDEFAHRERYETRFRAVIDVVVGVVGADLPTLKFRAPRLLYPLFCAVYHMQFGLPRLDSVARRHLRVSTYPKLKDILERVSQLIEAAEEGELPKASSDEAKVVDAYTIHWVHAPKRTFVTQYLCKQFMKVL